MAYNVKCRCPDCGDTYTVRIKDDSELPNFCPKCGSFVGPDDPSFVPTQMNIGTIKGKVVDQTYRQVEASSLVRAEMAGDPSLKITNMRDNLREGDVAAMPVNNAVTQYADVAKQEVGFDYWQANVAENVAMAKSGPGRQYSGSTALEAIQTGPSMPVVPQVKGLPSGWGGAR